MSIDIEPKDLSAIDIFLLNNTFQLSYSILCGNVCTHYCRDIGLQYKHLALICINILVKMSMKEPCCLKALVEG